MKRTASTALPLAAFLCLSAAISSGISWPQAEQNAAQSQRAIQFCRRCVQGWLAHADPGSGLIPRNLTGDAYWNAKDAAADNYPFIVLTAEVTDDPCLKEVGQKILVQEQRLTNRLDSLPDDFLFATRNFRTEKPDLQDVIFSR